MASGGETIVLHVNQRAVGILVETPDGPVVCTHNMRTPKTAKWIPILESEIPEYPRRFLTAARRNAFLFRGGQ